MTQQKTQNLSIWERFNAALEKRLHESLFNEMLIGKSLRSRFTLSRFLGMLVALCVYALAFSFFGTGVWIAVSNWGNFFALAAAVMLLGFAYLSFPRFPKLIRPALQRAEYPALYEMVDLVAQSLKTGKVDGIVVSEHFNASFTRVGWRQKRILHLGIPLFIVLDDREKIALIAHELAHDVNKDPIRNFFVQSALYVLINWYNALHPRQLSPEGSSQGLPFYIVWISQFLANLILLGLSGFAWLGIYLLSHLLWRESQRAEYLADYLSTQIGGSEYSKSVLNKFRHASKLTQVVAKVVLNYKNPMDVDVFENFRKEVQADNSRNLESLNNSSAYEFRMDSTHPSTQHRIQFLESLPTSSPKVSISPSIAEKLDKELALLKPKIQEKLIDLYESHISGGLPSFFSLGKWF